MQEKAARDFEIQRKPEALKMLPSDYFLSLQVQLEEIKNSKALSKTTENSDLSIAAKLLQDECAAMMESFRLASVIEAAGISDEMVAAFAEETARENNDRTMALRLANPRERADAEAHDRDLLAAFGNLQLGSCSVIPRPEPFGFLNAVYSSVKSGFNTLISECRESAPSSSRSSSTLLNGTNSNGISDSSIGKCVSCFESAKNKSVCGHYYCNPCITELC